MTSGEPFAEGAVIASKYRIERLLGEGGMGRVYAVRHEMLGQTMALKALRPDALTSSNALARFVTEARAAAAIKSENVASVVDVGILEEGAPYMVMELLDGVDLSIELRRRGKIPVAEAVDYVLQALAALATAHSLGIVHRDLKPANLFLAQAPGGRRIVKVLDFGISKATDPSHWLASSAAETSAHEVLGTPAYMSPEQLKSTKTVDARADIWSLGVILFELTTGELPFEGRTIGELFAAIFEGDAPRLRTKLFDAPEGLEAIVARCLARKPDGRFPDVETLASALAPFGSGKGDSWRDRARSAAPVALSSEPNLAPTVRASDEAITAGADANVVSPFAQTDREMPAESEKAPPATTSDGVAVAPSASKDEPPSRAPIHRVAMFLGAAAAAALLAAVWMGARGEPPRSVAAPLPTSASSAPASASAAASASASAPAQASASASASASAAASAPAPATSPASFDPLAPSRRSIRAAPSAAPSASAAPSLFQHDRH